MNDKDFERWIGRIFNTTDNEPDCKQVQEFLPAFVEAQLNGALPATTFPAELHIHLEQCPDCNETYEGLRFLVEQEAEGELSLTESVAEMPSPSPEQEPFHVSLH